METSTVVPGGDLAGRSAEYRRGYVAGWLNQSGGWLLCLYCILCMSFVGSVGLWNINVQRERADRAEAQLAEMRALATDAEREAVYQRNVAGTWQAIATRCLERAREVR